MIESALYAVLAGNAGVRSLVANATSPTTYRIYPLVIPQHVQGEAAQQPSIVYAKDGVDRQVLYSGTGSVVSVSFQIDCYALTHLAAITLAAAVRAALVDYAGVVAGVTIKASMIENEFSTIDAEPGLFRVTQFWTVWHVE